MPHLNNKQNKNTNPVISRQDDHLTQPRQAEEKQTSKQKLSTISPYAKLSQVTGPILKSENEVAQSCLTLCNPVNCSLPGSSILGILQARILEWVAISFSRGSSRPRDQTQISCIAGRLFTLWRAETKGRNDSSLKPGKMRPQTQNSKNN